MDIQQLNNTLFSPLDRKYCAYYQVLMYLSFFTFAMSVVTVVYRMFRNGLSKFSGFQMIDVLTLLSGFVSYFSTRLLYSMCIR